MSQLDAPDSLIECSMKACAIASVYSRTAQACDCLLNAPFAFALALSILFRSALTLMAAKRASRSHFSKQSL